jgi:hypothetical protein
VIRKTTRSTPKTSHFHVMVKPMLGLDFLARRGAARMAAALRAGKPAASVVPQLGRRSLTGWL